MYYTPERLGPSVIFCQGTVNFPFSSLVPPFSFHFARSPRRSFDPEKPSPTKLQMERARQGPYEKRKNAVSKHHGTTRTMVLSYGRCLSTFPRIITLCPSALKRKTIDQQTLLPWRIKKSYVMVWRHPSHQLHTPRATPNSTRT